MINIIFNLAPVVYFLLNAFYSLQFTRIPEKIIYVKYNLQISLKFKRISAS